MESPMHNAWLFRGTIRLRKREGYDEILDDLFCSARAMWNQSLFKNDHSIRFVIIVDDFQLGFGADVDVNQVTLQEWNAILDNALIDCRTIYESRTCNSEVGLCFYGVVEPRGNPVPLPSPPM
jgi:acetyltransferase-like isoleucine patch superfamily enzyme